MEESDAQLERREELRILNVWLQRWLVFATASALIEVM